MLGERQLATHSTLPQFRKMYEEQRQAKKEELILMHIKQYSKTSNKKVGIL